MDKRISAWLLIIFGGIGPLLTVFNIFGHPSLEQFLREILIVVGLLSVALGVQRLGSIQEILDFVKSRKLIWLDGAEEVYARAREMVRDCGKDECIRATDFFPYDKGEEFRSYFASIAERMKTSRLIYRLVAAVEANDGPGRKWLDRRYQIIRDTAPASLDTMDAKCVDQTFPLEVLIVGENVLLGFPSLAKDHKVTRGILIEDELVSKQFVAWYDNHLFAEAKKWNDKAPDRGAKAESPPQ